MTQYVQHISGTGQRWPLQEASLQNPRSFPVWFVYDPMDRSQSFTLPKSEYSRCEPSEVWVDVTEECELYFQPKDSLLCHLGTRVCEQNGYRLRRVQFETPHKFGVTTLHQIVWAFLVEKKQ